MKCDDRATEDFRVLSDWRKICVCKRKTTHRGRSSLMARHGPSNILHRILHSDKKGLHELSSNSIKNSWVPLNTFDPSRSR